MARGFLVLWLAVLVVLHSPCAALAAEPADDAAKLFREGVSAHKRGEFGAAAQSFERAHALSPSAPSLYNAARSWDAAHNDAQAADDYAACLVGPDDLEAGQREYALRRLEELQRTLSRLTIDGPPGGTVTVAHMVGRPLPTEVHLPPGTHNVAMQRSDGTQQNQVVTLQAGQVEHLSLTPPVVVIQPVAVIPQVVTPVGALAPPPPPTANHARRRWGMGLLGAGVVGGLGGGAMGFVALGSRDTFVSSGRLDAGARDKAETLRLWTNVTWGIAALSAGAGLWLLIDSRRSKHERAMLRLLPNGVSVTAHFGP